jgi:hypothetical protein
MTAKSTSPFRPFDMSRLTFDSTTLIIAPRGSGMTTCIIGQAPAIQSSVDEMEMKKHADDHQSFAHSAPLPLLSPPAKRNWIGVSFPDSFLRLPQTIVHSQNLVASCLRRGFTVTEEAGRLGADPPHITVVYGFKTDAEYERARVLVDEQKLTLGDCTIGDPYAIEPPHLQKATHREAVICLDVRSAKLHHLKQTILKETGATNPAEAQHNRVLPFHVTLFKLRRLHVEWQETCRFRHAQRVASCASVAQRQYRVSRRERRQRSCQ